MSEKNMKVMFVGDTHMATREITRINILAREHEVDKIIQVGDFGYTFASEFLNEIAGSNPIPWYFIRGNHDSTEWIKQAANVKDMWSGPTVQVSDNLFWIPDGSVLKLGHTWCAFVGGAASIDREYRQDYVSWWPDEEPHPNCLDRLRDKGKIVDFLISHDLPESLVKYQWSGPKIQHNESHRVRVLLDEALDLTGATNVIHGHWHRQYSRIHEHSIKVYGLGRDGMKDNHIILDM
jgi:calcineurin-like phosphoesterase family protein